MARYDQQLRPSRFPRSAGYDPTWVLENQMGPNVLWLAEYLTEALELRPGMRVLDLGCGKAVSSIFLACEFGVQVWATDLWIPASENWERIRAAGAEERVFPVYAEAHQLPYAHGFFDAVISIDAYEHFGTADGYLAQQFAPLVKPGGQIGICVPGVIAEFEEPPAHLAAHWEKWPDFWSFHSPAWWRKHWARSGAVDVEVADALPDGCEYWRAWEEATLMFGYTSDRFKEHAPGWIAALAADAGRNITFTRVVARRKSPV